MQRRFRYFDKEIDPDYYIYDTESELYKEELTDAWYEMDIKHFRSCVNRGEYVVED